MEKLDKTKSNFAKSMQDSLTDVYSELYVIKKTLSDTSSGKNRIVEKECYENFPIKSNKEFEKLNKKLNDETFFNDLKNKLTNHITSLDCAPETIHEFFKKLPLIVFDKSYVTSITWTFYEGKKTISGTRIVDLIQSKI